MKSLFIMTVRSQHIDRQRKFTIEHGNCMVRDYRLHPFTDIMVREQNVTQKKFIAMIMRELSINIGHASGANVYFNGENYRKFMNMGKCLW